MAAERHATNKSTTINATGTKSGKVRSFILIQISSHPVKKTTASAAAKNRSKEKDTWDWQAQKIRILDSLNDLLQLDLNKIWTMLNERAPFIG